MKIPIILKGYRNPIQWLFRSCFLLNVASLVEFQHTSASAPGGRGVSRRSCEDDDCRGDSSRPGWKVLEFWFEIGENAELGLSTTRWTGFFGSVICKVWISYKTWLKFMWISSMTVIRKVKENVRNFGIHITVVHRQVLPVRATARCW